MFSTATTESQQLAVLSKKTIRSIQEDQDGEKKWFGLLICLVFNTLRIQMTIAYPNILPGT